MVSIGFGFINIDLVWFLNQNQTTNIFGFVLVFMVLI